MNPLFARAKMSRERFEGEMGTLEPHETVETLLNQWQPALGKDYLPYHNHVYRVFNFAGRLADATEEDREKLAIAAAFHAEVLRVFPRQGFHRLLISLTWGWARKHPL